MIPSHGQSSIKCSASINKEILDKNLQERSLISKRLIYDHFTSKDIRIHEQIAPQALKQSSEVANGRYKIALEESKKETGDLGKSRKRKLKLE